MRSLQGIHGGIVQSGREYVAPLMSRSRHAITLSGLRDFSELHTLTEGFGEDRGLRGG